MYEDFYHFKEKPFTLQPDPDFLYLGKKHGIAYTMLEYGVTNGSPITVISGEIGSGKTTLIRHLLNQLDEDVAIGLISNTHYAFGELLSWVCSAFSIEQGGKDKVSLYQAFVDFMLEEFAKGKRTVLIVDEAQNMDVNTLEELRVLSNINADKDQLLQLILVGQPELRDTLRLPELEQLSQRVSVDFHLNALDADETDAYIQHRLKVAGGNIDLFEPDARQSIYEHSDGVPRIINNLCETALIYGFASQATKIDAGIINELIEDKIKNGGGLLVNRKRKKQPAKFETHVSRFKN